MDKTISYNIYNPDQYLSRKKFSSDYNVSKKTPKAFIWHTFSDEGVDVRNSLCYAKALREYGVSNPISVIPCGIRLEQHSYRLSARERCEMRPSLGIEDDQMVLLNLGRLGVEKNID